MSFIIYTFPSSNFDALKSELEKAHLSFELFARAPKKESLLVRDGLKRARIDDYTEKNDSLIHFTIVSGRNSFFGAIVFWPIDLWLARKLELHLRKCGASTVQFDEKENGA